MLHAFTLQNYKTVNASLDRTKGKIKKKDKTKEDYEHGYKKTQACALHPGPALISNNP